MSSILILHFKMCLLNIFLLEFTVCEIRLLCEHNVFAVSVFQCAWLSPLSQSIYTACVHIETGCCIPRKALLLPCIVRALTITAPSMLPHMV